MLLISDKTIYHTLRENLAQAQLRAHKSQREAASGMRVLSSADDPAAAGRGSMLGAQLATLTTMQRVGLQAVTRLETAETALDGAFDVVARARELSILGIDGTLGAADLQGASQEVSALAGTMLVLANSTDVEGYIFSGNLNVAPFNNLGTYSGDNGVRLVDLAPGTRVATNVPGNQIFNVTGGQNVFATLNSLTTALKTRDTNTMAVCLTELDGVIDQFNAARTTVASARMMASMGEYTRSATQLVVEKARAEALEVDQAASYVKAVEAQNALQSAIAETTKVLAQMQNNPLLR